MREGERRIYYGARVFHPQPMGAAMVNGRTAAPRDQIHYCKQPLCHDEAARAHVHPRALNAQADARGLTRPFYATGFWRRPRFFDDLFNRRIFSLATGFVARDTQRENRDCRGDTHPQYTH